MTSLLLLAEIISDRLATSRALAEIVATCGRDVGITLETLARAPRKHSGSAVVTLHLPAEYAADQHPAWCLACRLACFCPDARVSVLVHSELTFTQATRRRRLSRIA